MPWHAEVITLTLRRYEDGKSYENREPFASVATAQILGGQKAYISGFLNGSPAKISKRDWVALAILMREQFGIVKIESERHGDDKTFDTRPGELL